MRTALTFWRRSPVSAPTSPRTLHRPDEVNWIHTLHVHLVASPFQQRMQPPIAVARLLPRQLHQLLAQCDVAVRPRLIPIARPLHAQQLAGRAFAQPELDRDERNLFS